MLPIRRRRFGGAAAVLLVTLLATSLATGIASPRFSAGGGGDVGAGFTTIDSFGNPVTGGYDFLYVGNASLRPWTLEAVRAGGDASVASRIDRADSRDDRPDPPAEPTGPVTVGVGEGFTVATASPPPGPCIDGWSDTPRQEIEVLVSGLLGDRWIHVGTASGSRTGCQGS